MTQVNGLRLAYRGFVAGLAGGYVWAAIAMTLSGIAFGDPLRPLRPFADALVPVAPSAELAFVVGLAAVQAGGAFIGMSFAYFFGRFFTVRPTVAAAAPCFALLVLGLVAAAVWRSVDEIGPVVHPIAVLATIGFGLLLGGAVPLRGEVTRYPEGGSPST